MAKKYEEGSGSKVRPGDRRERERRISDSERNNQQRTLRAPGAVNLQQDQHNVVRGAQVSNSFSVLVDSADVDNAYNSEILRALLFLLQRRSRQRVNRP